MAGVFAGLKISNPSVKRNEQKNSMVMGVDENGNILKRVKKDEDRIMHEQEEYEHDENGKKTKELHTSGDGLEYEEITTYDEKGYPVIMEEAGIVYECSDWSVFYAADEEKDRTEDWIYFMRGYYTMYRL